MADYPRITGTIRPTPRNRVSGFLADLLELGAKGYDVGSTLQAGGPITEGRLSTPVSDLLGIPELQRTLNRISYNEPLTTGTGYTTKLRPDTLSAAMTVAPMVGPTAKAGAAGARMAGTALKDLATSDVAYNAAMKAMKRSGAVLGMADDEYRGSHLAPNAANYGAYLHDLSGIIPKDVYTVKGKSLYGLGDPVIDREWWMTAMKAKGKPDADVTIYRAVPKGVQNINSGDWVTTSKRYAENHGESALSGDYEIISKTVKAKDLSTAGDPQEYGYHPAAISSVNDFSAKYPDVKIDLGEGKNEINLSRIVVPKEMRNQGIGTQVMNDLSQYADQIGKRITLTPSGDFGGNVNRLKEFYKNLGFVENKGKNKDFSTRETMYRDPKQLEPNK